ncbi:MAG: hypothetical protein Q7T55_23450 [Solirubrobacteraceae bacterium]|nr:hypothetical protein [Solirubrobacteraceae bacterium]
MDLRRAPAGRRRRVLLAAALLAALPSTASADVDRGQAAPYYAAIEAWSSASAVKKAVPGLPTVGKAKATTEPLDTEQLFSLTFEPTKKVTQSGDARVAAKLPRGYPTSGLTPQLDKLRKAWATQFGKLPGDLEDTDLADVATVSLLVGLSVHSGDKKVLTSPGALVVRQADRQSLVAYPGFSKLTAARKQSAAEMLRIRTLLAYNTYGEERGQKDWKGVAQVRAGLRSWMRDALGVDPAKVTLGAKGLEKK